MATAQASVTVGGTPHRLAAAVFRGTSGAVSTSTTAAAVAPNGLVRLRSFSSMTTDAAVANTARETSRVRRRGARGGGGCVGVHYWQTGRGGGGCAGVHYRLTVREGGGGGGGGGCVNVTARAVDGRGVSACAAEVARNVEDIPVLSATEVYARLAVAVHPNALETFAAFYSSWTGCITTDPAAMVLPMDDHMAHRGHGVFDTAHLEGGALHMLDRHLDRFHCSMASARVISPFDCATLRGIILRTAAASGLRDGQIRYYASAGPGGFALSHDECVRSTFYCMVVKKVRQPLNPAKGVVVVTSPVPIKPPAFAVTKSVNYLQNVMVVADAHDRGADYGVWITQDGLIGEGPSMNIGFVTHDGVFCCPPFDDILAGCTIARVMELVDAGHVAHLGVTRAEFRPVTPEEAKSAKEVMLVGSVINVAPVVLWDGAKMGRGEGVTPGVPGPVALALHAAVVRDFVGNHDELTPVPYHVFEEH